MTQKIDIGVAVVWDRQPQKVVFGGREYVIKKIGFHHTYRMGRTLFHVFSAISETMFFRLVLNTDNLLWRLEEIADANFAV